jgi:hypothetical protein
MSSKRSLQKFEAVSFNPPQFIGNWERKHLPKDETGENYISPVIQHNETGLTIVPYPILDRRKNITAENIGEPRIYAGDGTKILEIDPQLEGVLDIIEKTKTEFLQSEIAKKKRKKTRKYFEDLGEDSNEEEEKSSKVDEKRSEKNEKGRESKHKHKKAKSSHHRSIKPEKKVKPMKKERKKPVNHRTIITEELLKKEIEALDRQIRKESAQKYRGKGIPFIYKVLFIQLFFTTYLLKKDASRDELFYKHKSGERSHYRVRAIGAKFVKANGKSVKYSKMEPILKFQHIETGKAAAAIKILIATAMHIPVAELPPDYNETKGYIKLVKEGETDFTLGDLYHMKYRYVKIVSPEEYELYVCVPLSHLYLFLLISIYS